ncbi:tyrosine-type recombinase/integrase [Rhodohalobacter halophilus]|uniref:tyrosine-type recombinase/integrase n=1 Tax=Rhodohalobacter halophilus TaxID=1812810 RepID=UPI00083FD2D8|nr:site-specific integrase [Rhodohalobacter halophilus]
MASLKKRNGYYSLSFKTTVDGKTIKKTFALGTRRKQIAEQKKNQYEKLYESGELNPFEPGWNLKEFEQRQMDIEGAGDRSLYLSDLKEEFLDSKTNITQKSKDAYDDVIGRFVETVGESLPIHRVTVKDLKEYCLNPDLANASKKNYLRHLKAFFNWAVKEELIQKNPCNEVKVPKVKENVVDKIIDESQLKKMLSKFTEVQEKRRANGELKNAMAEKLWFRPLMTMAFYTGMRRKEIINLDWSHVKLKERFLRVTDTKNGQERTVPIFDPLYIILNEWHQQHGTPDHGLVFPHPRSTEKLKFPLLGNHISKTFNAFAKEAGIKKTANFHGLRHSCATFLLRKGFNVIEVKNMLGHRSLEVTNRYVHLVANDLITTASRTGLIK